MLTSKKMQQRFDTAPNRALELWPFNRYAEDGQFYRWKIVQRLAPGSYRLVCYERTLADVERFAWDI